MPPFAVTEEQLATWLAGLLWPLLRTLALFATAPVLGHKSIPARFKVAFALVIAICAAPSLPVHDPETLRFPTLYLVTLQQLLVGAAMGFSMRLVFAALELAGDLVGLQMGISFATFIDPQSSTPSPLIGSFLGALAMLVFLSLNGHALLIASVVESFTYLPVAQAPATGIGIAQVAAWGGELFRLGLHVALPMLAALLICNLALGVLVRAAPQLNLISVGFPITLWMGFMVMLTTLPYLAPGLQHAMELGLGGWRAR